MKYPNNVKRYRLWRGYTQQQLADKVNRRREYLSQIENGHERPGSDLMYKLAEALECGLDDLFLPKMLDESSQKESTVSGD